MDMRFGGETYDAERDGARLAAQIVNVFLIVCDGSWHTLGELAAKTGAPEASVSARLRDLRKRRFGAWIVERRYVRRGLHEYRLIVPPDENGVMQF